MTDLGHVAIRHLELEQFRAHVALTLDVPPAGLRIHGPNGSGKTTILEAIQLLSTTRPRRGALDNDLIHHESGRDLGLQPYARVVGVFDRAGAVARVEAFIQRGVRGNTARKTLKVGERARRAADVVGLIPTVSFAPDDLELVLGTPSIRRRFLDVLLSQTDKQYLRCLGKYAKILAQRNGLLRRVDALGPTADQFVYWDEQLVALGSYLVAARVRAVARLAACAAARFELLAPGIGELQLAYVSTLDAPAPWWRALVSEPNDTFDAAQRVGVMFERRLRESGVQERARGMTVVGPHRDDISVALGGRELARFGSRGQQRVAVIAVKLAEIDVISSTTSLRPIFLIDDVLSELDMHRRRALLQAVAAEQCQLLVTSTEAELLEDPALTHTGELELG